MNIESPAQAAVFMNLVSLHPDGYHVTPSGFGNPDHIVVAGVCSTCPSPCYAPRAVEIYLERGGSQEVGKAVMVPKGEPIDLITPPQKALIGVICAARGLHADEVARRIFGKGIDALSKKQAGRMIERIGKVRTVA